jgi:hypothetical protein
MRHPIERLLSRYYYDITVGKARKQHTSVNSWLRSAFEDEDQYFNELFEIGLYHKHIERYLGLFAREQLYCVLYEDIETDPLKTVKGLYAFVGVDDTFVPPSIQRKVNVTASNELHIRWLSRVLYRSWAWVGNNPFGRRLRTPLKRLGCNAIVKKLFALNKRSSTRAPVLVEKETLEPVLRNTLNERYLSDVTALESFLNRDLSTWKQ